MFLLEGELLDGKESFDWLIDSIQSSKKDVQINICSAFIKAPVLSEIVEAADGRSGRVLVRWQKLDIVSGSSDLEIFEVAKKSNWEVYADLRFHGKIYALRNIGILIGSANATKAGFSYGIDGNKEICTVVKPTHRSLDVIDQLFGASVKIDAQIFASLKKELLITDEGKNSAVASDWNIENLSKLEKPISRGVFVADFFQRPYSLNAVDIATHDLDLLTCREPVFNPVDIQKKMIKLRVVQELISLCERDTKGVWFGTITAHFHDLLLDDPAPYRSDVKQLVENLLSWVGAFLSQTFELSRPSYSLRVRLRKYIT